jgi:hypothetical protein
MSDRTRRALRWVVVVLAGVVAAGVFAQVYLISAAYFGVGSDALDAHGTVGGIVHGIQALVFLVALIAYWREWTDVGLAFALIAIGTLQIGLSDAADWVGGLHGLLAMVVLANAAVIAMRGLRSLRSRPRAAGPTG